MDMLVFIHVIANVLQEVAKHSVFKYIPYLTNSLHFVLVISILDSQKPLSLGTNEGSNSHLKSSALPIRSPGM